MAGGCAPVPALVVGVELVGDVDIDVDASGVLAGAAASGCAAAGVGMDASKGWLAPVA